MAAVGCGRVSTHDQDLALQLNVLQQAGGSRAFEDYGASGAKVERPGLAAALVYVGGRAGSHILQPIAWGAIIIGMNKAHRTTLAAIFARPTPANLRWAEVGALVVALGGVVEERAGSRMWAEINGTGAVFHRPHPRPEAKKGAVEAMRKLLVNAGIKP
jgi:hypothetical protein